jgi:two-component system response regulator MprA
LGAKRILLAEDDELVRAALAELLVLEEYRVTTAVDGLDALARAVADPPDLVVTDLQMPRLRGDGLVAELRAAGLCMPVILVTAASVAAETMPAPVLRKPFDVDESLAIVQDALVDAALPIPAS